MLSIKNHRFEHLGGLGSPVKGISEGILENMALMSEMVREEDKTVSFRHRGGKTENLVGKEPAIS